MGMLTWKQAAADYEKKSAGSNTAGTTPPTSGMHSWKQAADEFDRYDEDGYKALGMQRMTQMQERYQAQKDRVSGLERLHADDTVNDWLNRYNRVIQGITRSEQKRNGGFTRDADSVYGAEIDALLSGYDGIKNHSEIRQYYDSLTELKNSLNAINDSFSQFEDESAFDQYMAYWKDQEEKKNLDLDAYSREIAALEQQLEDYDPEIDWTNPTERKQYDKGLQELEDEIRRRKQYLAQAQRIQKKDDFSTVANPESEKYDAAFDSKSGYVSTEQDGKLQRMMSQYSMGYDDLTYEYINNQNGIRDTIKQKAGAYKKGETPFEARGYDYMTEDEVGLYNYYYSMGGKASAEAYLDTIQEDLNQRKAAGMYQQMEGKTGAELVFGVEAGLDQFKGGIKGAVRAVKGDDSYVAPSATQYASGMVREDLADDGFKLPSWLGGASLGQVGYDAITTTANMAPSIAVGMLNPTLGTAALGVSAGGSAYQEALNEGYSVDQARGYGILSGASEVIMEKVLGGISAYGGNSLGKFFTQNMKNADTALKRIAKELGGSMLSEFSEEYLQEVLTPVFQNLTLGTDNEVKLVSAEALYAGFLGAITGGIMEGPQAIANARNATVAPNNATELANNATTENTTAVDNKTKATVGVSKMETVQVKPDMDSFAQQFGTQAEAVKRNYLEGQDLQEYEVGFQTAYAMGLEGGKQEALGSVPYLSQSQREIAFSLGRDAAAAQNAAAPKKAAVTAKMTTEEGTQDVTIAEVVDMDDTTMTFRLEDGRTVTDNDLDFETGQLVMSAVWETGMDIKNANAIIKASAANTAADADQAVGIQQAYHYGQQGYTMEQLTKHGTDSAALTDDQRKAAWEAGRQIYLQKSAAPVPALKATKASGVWFDAGGGNVRAFDAADLSGLSEAAVAGARAAQVLQKLGIGKNYYFYESYVNKTGERVYKDENGDETIAPNGWFDRADGSIHIDLNAGAGGKGLTLYTLSHELTHFVEDWDKQGYRKLSEFLVSNYAKRGNVDAMVAAKQAELSSGRGSSVSYEEAYSEFIADSMEAMLSDGNVLEKLQELKKTDDSLFGKIKEFFDNLARKIRAIYKNLTPDSVEGQAVLQMKDQIEEIQKLFTEALVEAGHNFNSAMEQVIQADAEPVMTEEIVTDGAVVTDGNGARYSIRSMKSDIAEGQMFDDLQTYCNWSKAQVDQLKKDLTELVDYMTPFRDVLDLNETYGREGRRFSPYKPNSDPLYQISMDFSTLCSKRLLTQFVIENLQLRENRPMTAEEQMAILDMLIEYRKQEKGLQVACAMCYVEAARLKSPKQMQRWLNDPAPLLRDYFSKKNKAFNDSVKKAQADFKESRGYKRDAPKKEMKQADIRELNKIGPRMRGQYQLTAEEAAIVERAMELPNSTYLTAGNLAALSESDPVIYDAYTSFVRTATRSKSLETDEPYYYGDSRRDNGNGIIVSDSFIEAVNRENGMRFSSWSDWRIQHMLDYITAVIDNAVRGAAMHGYTKFPEEVRVLGKTGMMFNLSGVAGTQTGLNPDGSLSFSPTESIDKDEAVQLREDFPETAGLQCIGVGDDHIRELMKSDIIDYIIPYHVSGLNKALRTMADIQGWKDYTGTQHASIDHSVKLQDAADPEHWHEEPVFSEFFVGYDTGMTGIEAMQASAERYRQMCHDRGLIPKFNQFYEKGNNYWKLLIDRKMINQKTGKLIQQKPVTPTFDFNEIKAVVKRHVDNYDSNMEARALNHIVENWDSVPGRIKDLKKGKKKTAPSLKAVNEVANQMLAAQKAENPLGIKPGEVFYSDIRKSERVKDKRTLEFLNNQETITTYKTMQLVDGKLYPPMAARTNGEYEDYSMLGSWEQATEHPELIQDGNKYKLDKGKGQGSLKAAYNPYMHSSNLVLNDQFTGAYTRNNLVTVECEVPVSELTSGYHAQYAKDPVGWHAWHTGTVAGSLRKARGIERQVFLSRWIKPVRILPDSEVASMYSELLSGTDIEVPDNVVTPSLLKELRNAGVKIKESGRIKPDAGKRYQARATGTSNRDLLAGAFEDLARSPAEMEFLQKYQENIGLLNEQEAKLQEIRTEIRELTFGKGPKDPKRLEKLQEEAGKTANRIHIYDKKLLQLESAKPLRDVLDREREKVRKATRQKGQEAMAEYREKRNESAARKDAKRKIRKTVMELDKLLNRGDKKKNVKSGMTSMVDSVLKLADALFMDEYTNRDMLRNGVGVELTDAEEKLFLEAQQILQQAESGAAIDNMEYTSEVDAMNQLKKLDQKLSSKMAGLKDVFTRERKRLYGTTVSDLLGKLADEYSRLSEAEDGAVRAAKDENVYAHLLQLQKDVGGTTVRDMTLGQMEAVADAFTMVLTTVRNANKMFAKNLKFKRDTLAAMVMGEIGAAVKKISKLIRPGKNAIDSFSWNNLKPVYAFERLGSETLKTLYQNIRSGQDVWSRDMQEADAFRREQYRKHNRKSWDLEKQHRFEFESGIVELSLEQIMSLYAYSRREQALDHLLKGGFVFSGSTEVMVKEHGIQRRYLKKDATAYNLTADELLQVVDTLTKEQKDFVEEMQTYLSDVMGGKGNEISLQMYGIRSYGEKNYFPIRSAGQYMERAKEDSFRKEQGQISIVNSGFTKSTTPKANNPITLDGFMNVWAEHVNDMSMYHGFALPMEDFRRVYNYSSPNMEAGNSQSVNAVIENAFGKAATGYIDQLYKDLNGGAVSDNRENLSKKLVGLHKKAAVFASASVVVQQPSAIVRAFALIDPKHFVGPKVDRKRHKQLWEEVKKYAPVAFVKEMGYFDTGMGRSARDFLQAEEYSGIREKMTALFKDADYRDEILGKAPALADELTWCSIWEAVKRETKAKNPDLDVRSDAFLQIAGARFSEVIDKTQVYDSVLSRSANMRSKSGLMNMVTSFLAEPTTSINMLEDALRKGDRQQLKRTVGAVYGSVLLNSLLVSLVYAARDDDEDETWWEKYLSSVAVEMMDGINPITYYPFLRDVWSIGQGFDAERADMTLISDFADAAKKVIAAGMNLRDAAEEEKTADLAEFKDSLWGMTDVVASLTGLPLKNIRRDIEGARNVVRTIQADLNTRDTTGRSLMDAVLGEVMNSIPIGGLLYSKNKRDRLYGALVAGDAAYVQRLKAGYESDSAYHSAIKMALRDNDSRIWEAAVAWNSGDMETYLRIAKEIRGENRFDQDDIVLAIRAEANSMEESQDESASTVKGYFTNEKFGVALGQNNTSMADIIRKDLIDTKVANGKTREEAEESVRNSARTQLKELYASGSINAANARKMLERYGEYDSQDAAEKVAEWQYEKDHPELDGRITYTQYKRWEADGKSRGVALDTFTDVAEYQDSGTSGSNRSQAEVADYINRLPISTAQKDALWCCFWKESTLYKNAPWH